MAKNPQQKDEALEALDFIVNVLKEHERDLDKLINELATVTEQMGDTGELTEKVEKVEEKITNLQKEVTSLLGNLSSGAKVAASVLTTQTIPAAPAIISAEVAPTPAAMQPGHSVVLRCKQWEDFQALASHAQTVSFNYKEDEKVFQVDALKGSQVITYSGPLPRFSVIMKAFLARQLDVSERCILEGVLALG
jgi:ABC-type transporter Mla subunit MlaD